ncbi:hypothetical protein [Caenimonas sp. SL110]|uniref:hypothetical protein n=1 Tax=Caenimonas sp. SL110 TaxID=1450524 RepID=UPI00065304A6|nr:hypothetical protein [Caenimonas sp. SL110]
MNISRTGGAALVMHIPVTQPVAADPEPLTTDEQNLLKTIRGLASTGQSGDLWAALSAAGGFKRQANAKFRALAAELIGVIPDRAIVNDGTVWPHLAQCVVNISDSESMGRLVAALLRRDGRAVDVAIELIAAMWKHKPHEADLPTLTDLVIDTACRGEPTAARLHKSIDLVRVIEDPDFRSRTAQPLKLQLFARIEQAARTAASDSSAEVQWHTQDLVSILDPRLGRNDELVERLLQLLPGLLEPPVIAGNLRFCHGSAGTVDALCLAALRLADHHKARLAQTLLSLTLTSGNLLQMAKMVRSISDEQIRDGVQAALYPQLVARARPKHAGDSVTALFAEAIYIDQGQHPELLAPMLQQVIEVLGPGEQDRIALLTLQIDPDGLVVQPGTQVRDSQNARNPDRLVGGRLFFYISELAQRREFLQEACRRRSGPQQLDAISQALGGVRDLALTTQAYVGTSIHPSDWLRLREMLDAARNQAPALQGNPPHCNA